MGKSKPGAEKKGDDYEDAREAIFQTLFDEYHDSTPGRCLFFTFFFI
jgi:hypothetical protein